MPQHVDDLICREAHLRKPVRALPKRENERHVLPAVQPASASRSARTRTGQGWLEEQDNARFHICPIQPRQSRFCCWVVCRRWSWWGCRSSVYSARSVRPRGRIRSSVDLSARRRDLLLSVCPFCDSSRWERGKKGGRRTKEFLTSVQYRAVDSNPCRSVK